MSDIICSYMFFRKPIAQQFYFAVPRISWVWKEGILALWKAESYPMGDGRTGKFGLGTSP